jgi:hypothetical protein
MGVFYQQIPPSLLEWLRTQPLFYVATAPLSGQGHINVSPKGGPYYGIPDNKTFWYMDMTGSGSETIAHLNEPGNGRICVMFAAFEGAPKIVRLWGHGRVIERGPASSVQTEFEQSVKAWNVPILAGTRSVIVVEIEQVGSSCGFSVPFFEFKGWRDTLKEFYEKKKRKFDEGDDKESMERYWAFKNAWSVDGLPATKVGLETAKKENIKPIKKFVGVDDVSKDMGRGRHGNGKFVLGNEHLAIVAIVNLVLGLLLGLYGAGLLGTFVDAWRSGEGLVLPGQWSGGIRCSAGVLR